MNVAYVRVSTVEQNEARQIEALQKHHIDKWFTEKISGKIPNGHSCRPCLTLCARETRFISTISAALRAAQKTCWNWLNCFTAKKYT